MLGDFGERVLVASDKRVYALCSIPFSKQVPTIDISALFAKPFFVVGSISIFSNENSRRLATSQSWLWPLSG